MNISTISSIEKAKNFSKKFFVDNSPFISFDFFKNLETSGCTDLNSGWLPEHIVFKKKDKIIGLIPNFKKLNSNGEYVFDHSFANAYHQIGLNYYPKYLSAIPFTPVTKDKFVYTNQKLNEDFFIKQLKSFLEKSCMSSFHLNFVNKRVSDLFEKFGFFKRLGIQYYWYNNDYDEFDSFLEMLKTRKKKNIIKERNFLKDNNISTTSKRGKEISKKDFDLFFNCYINTINKKWSIPYLKSSFFNYLLKSEIINNLLIIQAFYKKEFIGCSLHFIGNKTLYGRYWGCIKEVPFLHFELCYYSAIEFAIRNKLKKVEAGAQGEHKIARGYIPELTYSNHLFKNEKLSEIINKYLEQEKEKIKESLNFLEGYIPFKN